MKNIRIVLIETSHSGNIGAAARAMKTMGIHDLVLVNPKNFPSVQAVEMASGADDVLENARVVTSLAEAIDDCVLVIGASARLRDLELNLLDPRECGERAYAQAQSAPVALVFGRESSGLRNMELNHCNYHVFIPTNPEYSSLNLAAAVQVVCYECRMASEHAVLPEFEPEHGYAPQADVERFYKSMEEILLAMGFLKSKSPRKLMMRLKRLFNRVHLEQLEVNLLRGISEAIRNLAK